MKKTIILVLCALMVATTVYAGNFTIETDGGVKLLHLDNVTGNLDVPSGALMESGVLLSDTYFDALADFTGTLTDTYICTYNDGGTEIVCNTDPASIGGGNTTEQIQDASWGESVLEGTQTHITVTYDDDNNNVDFVVADDWWNALADISLTSGQIIVGSAGNVASAVAMSGHATISNTGVVSVISTAGLSMGNITGFNITKVSNLNNDLNFRGDGNFNITKVSHLNNDLNFRGDGNFNITLLSDLNDDIGVATDWDELTDMVLADASIYIGDGSNDPVANPITGDITLTNTGVVSVITTAGLSMGNITGFNVTKVSDLNDDSGHLSNVVEDLTPQLGGNLDLNGMNVTSAPHTVVMNSSGMTIILG